MSARIAWPAAILVASSFLLASPSLAGPWVLGPKEWYAEVESGVFASPNTYLDSGASQNVGLKMEQRDVALRTELGFKHKINFFTRLPLISVTRLYVPTGYNATATGFQDLQLGLRYGILTHPVVASVELSYTAPLGYNRYLDTLGMNLGDGMQQLKLEGHAGYSFGNRGFAELGGGYASRFLGTKGLSASFSHPEPADPSELTGAGSEKFHYQSRLHGTADVAVWVGNSLLVSGGYRGFVTLQHGALAEDINLHLFGPQVLYRLDDRVDLYMGSWTSTAGRNIQSFTQVYAGLAFRKTKLNRVQGFLGGKHAP
jgi:hypothetical protein